MKEELVMKDAQGFILPDGTFESSEETSLQPCNDADGGFENSDDTSLPPFSDTHGGFENSNEISLQHFNDADADADAATSSSSSDRSNSLVLSDIAAAGQLPGGELYPSQLPDSDPMFAIEIMDDPSIMNMVAYPSYYPTSFPDLPNFGDEGNTSYLLSAQ